MPGPHCSVRLQQERLAWECSHHQRCCRHCGSLCVPPGVPRPHARPTSVTHCVADAAAARLELGARATAGLAVPPRDGAPGQGSKLVGHHVDRSMAHCLAQACCWHAVAGVPSASCSSAGTPFFFGYRDAFNIPQRLREACPVLIHDDWAVAAMPYHLHPRSDACQHVLATDVLNENARLPRCACRRPSAGDCKVCRPVLATDHPQRGCHCQPSSDDLQQYIWTVRQPVPESILDGGHPAVVCLLQSRIPL